LLLGYDGLLCTIVEVDIDVIGLTFFLLSFRHVMELNLLLFPCRANSGCPTDFERLLSACRAEISIAAQFADADDSSPFCLLASGSAPIRVFDTF